MKGTFSTRLTEREQEILHLLAEEGDLAVGELQKQLGVSAVTVRNDLNSLAEKGLLARTRGGAIPAFHASIIERQNRKVEERKRIAKAAAALVQPGDTVMIEAGTTTALIARYLLGKPEVRVVTNSTLLIPYARINPSLNLTVVGGEFRPSTESFVGPMALRALEQFHVTYAFVGTDGFSLKAGLTTHLVEGAEIVKKMAALARHTVLTADGSKYGHTGFVKVLPLQAVEILISDYLPAGVETELETYNITVTIV